MRLALSICLNIAMSPTQPNSLLGIGLYTPAEAALYARLTPQTMSRWLFGSSRGEPAIEPQLGNTDERFVTFLDLVQSLAIRSIRLTHKVSLPKIREAVEFAKEETSLSYPLARKHTIFVNKNKEIIINVGGQESKKYIEATGSNKRALLLTEIAEPFMDDIGFDATGLAEIWKPFRYKNCEVRIDPKIHFGEPMLPSCGYSAQALWDAYVHEGGIQPAAKAYGVAEADVETAWRYFDYILPKSAA